jgi:hypothetical protein
MNYKLGLLSCNGILKKGKFSNIKIYIHCVFIYLYILLIYNTCDVIFIVSCTALIY